MVAIQDAIEAVLPEYALKMLPFVASLWIFMVTANLVGVFPGLRSPTATSLTAALALLVFFSTHWYGIRIHGIKRYLHHYLEPNPLLLPFHIISEISRTIALAVRLFGNMFSLGMAALLILLVAGFLVPVPVLALHIVEALVQAYIFGMLALIYIAGGIQSLDKKRKGVAMSDMTWFTLISTVAAASVIAIGAIVPALAMGRAIVQALDALARQPEAEKAITRTLFIGLAMIESLAIYVLVVVLIILFGNPLLAYLLK